MRWLRTILVLLSALVVAFGVLEASKWIDPRGAVVVFYRGTNFEHRVWMTTADELDFFAAGRPGRFVPADRFSGRWTAWLNVPESAEYSFATLSNDGIRLLIDDKLVIDNWRNQEWGDSSRDANKRLERGKHRLEVDFYDDVGGARFRVEWCGGPVPPRTVIGAPFLFKRF